MNPFYDTGICHTCHAQPKCGECNPCARRDCACPEPIFGIDKVAGKSATYRFNIDGLTVTWDFEPGILAAQTDTSLVVDIINRLLNYSAELHTDSISASELGSILHLNDLGDVSTKDADDGAMMVFKKSNTCPSGCIGTSNVWEPWNALDEQATSAAYGYGFDNSGHPVTLQQPTNPSQYYNLGWNGDNQLSYAQPVEETAPILDDNGKAWQMYLNPRTKQPYYVKVNP